MEIDVYGKKVLIDEEDYEKVKAFNLKVDARGYVYFYNRSITGNRTDTLHRYILGLKQHDGFVVDHINGNPSDNRKCNIRKCKQGENVRNQKINKRNKLGVKGVCYCKERKKYAAYIQHQGKTIALGRYLTQEEAHAAYCEASKKYHGEFGRTE